MSGSASGRVCAKSSAVSPGSGSEVGAAIGRGMGPIFSPAWRRPVSTVSTPSNATHIHDLVDAHRRLSPILGHELVGVVQRASNARHQLDARGGGQLGDLGIAVARIRVSVLFEDQVRDAPRLEELREQRRRRLAHEEELGLCVELGDARREVRLAVKAASRQRVRAPTGAVMPTGTSIGSARPSPGRRSADPTSRWGTGTPAPGPAPPAAPASRAGAGQCGTSTARGGGIAQDAQLVRSTVSAEKRKKRKKRIRPW